MVGRGVEEVEREVGEEQYGEERGVGRRGRWWGREEREMVG